MSIKIGLQEFRKMPFSEYKSRFIQNPEWRGRHQYNREVVFRKYKNKHKVNPEIIYLILSLIKDGITSREEIYSKIKNIFFSISSYRLIYGPEIPMLINFMINEGLIRENIKIELEITADGEKFREFYYHGMAHGNWWFNRLLNEKVVMIITFIILSFLSILKIITGIKISSQGMISEGLENFTDIIKIVIIYLGIRYNKDKTASLSILILMLFTGVSLIYSGIIKIINSPIIEINFSSFTVVISSILLNLLLLYYKGLIGRRSGNLSLLSDSKDSEMNVNISIGVLIGLIAGYFKISWVDSILSIIIGMLCTYESIEIILEFMKKGQEFDISMFNVKADNIYGNKVSVFLLDKIKKRNIEQDDLLNLFDSAVNLGRKYFGGFADFFYEKLGFEVAKIYLEKLKEKDLIKLNSDQKLTLTKKGSKFLNRKLEWETKHRLRIFKKQNIQSD